MRDYHLIQEKITALQERLDFVNSQLAAIFPDGIVLPFNIVIHFGPSPLIDCQYNLSQLFSERAWLTNQKSILEQTLSDKLLECDNINASIVAANTAFTNVTQSCSSLADRITAAQTSLNNLEVNTLQYEKQKNYLFILTNEYKKCIRSTNMHMTTYNTVFITQIYSSNEFEGNVMVFGDDEWVVDDQLLKDCDYIN
jgi:chromosome segregation ATPase